MRLPRIESQKSEMNAPMPIIMSIRKRQLLAFIICLTAFLAQQTCTLASATDATPITISAVRIVPHSESVSVASGKNTDAGSQKPPPFALGSRIEWTIEKPADAALPGSNTLIVYIDHIPLPNIHPSVLGTVIAADITRSSENKDAWVKILSLHPKFTASKINIAFGTTGGIEYPGKERETTLLDLQLIDGWDYFLFIGLSILVTWIICYLFKKYAFLRASGLDQPKVFSYNPLSLTNPAHPPGKLDYYKRPFSLARVQMLCWLCVSVYSFLFLLAALQDYHTLTDQVLILLGIGGGTLAFGTMLDVSTPANLNPSATSAKFLALVQSIAASELAIAALQAAAPQPPNVRALLDQEQLKIEQSKSAIDGLMPRSESLFADLINDENGPAIHRVQILIWTLVVLVVFLYSVVTTMTMPQLPTELLTLIGISNGTYVLVKGANRIGQ